MRDVQVTEPCGWMDIALGSKVEGAPERVRARLHLVRGVDGRPFLEVAELDAGGKRFESMFEVMTSDAVRWARELGPALLAEIARRAAQPPHDAG